MPARRSLGGHAVQDSLRDAGFIISARDVALVETQRPQAAPFRAILAQNAFNVISWRAFSALTAPYPSRMRARMLSRRMLALSNLRRASRVVCLTDFMAEMCVDRGCSDVTYAPVTLPLALTRPSVVSASDDATQSGWALVPGTVTWYKDPLRSLDVIVGLKRQGLTSSRVAFAGPDDGSGCWPAVERRAQELGLACSRRVVSPAELVHLYSTAEVVVLSSRLESLGFSLSEALVLSKRVVASAIPPHIELARRVGREPTWLHDWEDTSIPWDVDRAVCATAPDVLSEWVEVGVALKLESSAGRPPQDPSCP